MATSKEEILKTSRVLIQQNGWEAVNIRAVAAACGVSVGCIYNYFGSKTDLVSAAVESIWSDIFRHPDDPAVFEDTLSCIRWMYAWLCAAGYRLWQAADAADLAAHSGCADHGADQGQKDPARRIY